MIPLLLFSLLAIALILERCVFWWQVQTKQQKVIPEFFQLYKQDSQAAMNFLLRHQNLPIARIFVAALELEQATPQEFQLALESASQAELPLLKRFNTIFETVISIAPLLGLLGTVLGLITSFASLRVGQVVGSNAAGVTGGISEALISTAAGLVVAIVTLLFSNTFRGLYRRQFALIQEYGGRLELLYRRQYASRYDPGHYPQDRYYP